MAVVDLTGLPIRRAVPQPFRFGGVVTSTTGGASTRVDRMGSRWAFQFVTPPMLVNSADYRQWSAAIGRAEREGALCAVKLPGRTGLVTGSTVAASLVSSGRTLPITGIAAGYTPGPGDWCSVIVGGQRYLDRIDGASAVSGAAATLVLANLVRVAIPVNTVVELAAPKIEGNCAVTANPEWDTAQGMMTAFEFTVTEAR